MSDFQTYLLLGFEHILDFEGYDHLIFICALCATFSPKEWRILLIQITAFTIGHSISLALSVSNLLSINSSYIEILIPITILITSGFNLRKKSSNISWRHYFLTLFFGLIHGLGFSYLLKMLLSKNSTIFFPLLAFNLGIEIGQIGIVCFFVFMTIITTFVGINHQYWSRSISILTFFLGFMMLLQKIIS